MYIHLHIYMSLSFAKGPASHIFFKVENRSPWRARASVGLLSLCLSLAFSFFSLARSLIH